MAKAGERDPMERVAFWREQVAKITAQPAHWPGRASMLAMAEERLRMWARRARVAA